MSQILIVTHSSDYTVDYIIEKFKNIDFFRLNTDLIDSYSIEITGERIKIINNISDKCIVSDECKSVYFRRLMLPDFNEYENSYIQTLTSDFISYIEGIIDVFSPTVLTKPTLLRRADNKVIQSQLARKFGLKIPTTLITTSSEVVTKFLSCEENVIVKPLSIGRLVKKKTVEIVQTNLVDKSIDIPPLTKNPTYFQKYIEKEFEFRITIINNNIYTVKIFSENKIDWRSLNNIVKYEIAKAPKYLEQQCLAIMNELNINYAAFDFIYDGNEYYFLELNANGQWLWLEQELNLDISEKIIEYLIGVS